MKTEVGGLVGRLREMERERETDGEEEGDGERRVEMAGVPACLPPARHR